MCSVIAEKHKIKIQTLTISHVLILLRSRLRPFFGFVVAPQPHGPTRPPQSELSVNEQLNKLRALTVKG